MSHSDESASGLATEFSQPEVSSEMPEGSTRQRQMTDKGMEWQLNRLKTKFRQGVTKWQRQVSSLSILLSDSDDKQVIRLERQKLDDYFSELSEVYDSVSELDSADSLSDRYDSVASEHKALMLQISNTVRSLSLEKDSTLSQSSKHSSVSTKVSVAAEAASLKAKLKFVEAESRAKAALEKIEITKELEMANAKLVTFESMEQGSTLADSVIVVPQQVDNLLSF